MTLAQVVASARALILDFDGPMCSVFSNESAESVAAKLNSEISHLGLELDDDHDPLSVLRRVAGVDMTEARRVARLLTELELSASRGAEPTEGLVDLLRRTVSHGKIQVASNNSAEVVRYWLRASRLDHLIYSVHGREVELLLRMKPDPWCLEQALATSGIEPDQAVFIGDSTSDGEAALAVGIPFVPFASKPGKRQAFEDLGFRGSIQSMDDLMVEAIPTRSDVTGVGQNEEVRGHRRTEPQLLIFDADDTLWETEVLYDEARERAADLVGDAGFDRLGWIALQKQIDLKNVEHMGLSRDRFPTSSVEALETLSQNTANSGLRQRVWDAAASVFNAPATILPSVVDTLEALAEHHTLVLLTKGDRDIQHARIRRHRIAEMFDGVLIVEKKNRSTFSGICELYGYRPDNSWSIGNSVPSDIVPADAAGLRTVWLDAYVWGHERPDQDLPADTIELGSIEAIVDVIDRRFEGVGDERSDVVQTNVQ